MLYNPHRAIGRVTTLTGNNNAGTQSYCYDTIVSELPFPWLYPL